MFMAHIAKKTSVIHDMVYGKYASLFKMNVMMRSIYIAINIMCDTQQAIQGEERGTIVFRFLVGL